MITPIFKILKEQNRLLLAHVICILVFSVIYYVTASKLGSEKDKERFNSFEDSLYYTVITHFTIGFGDISPDSKAMRRLTILQVFIAFALMNR